MARRRRRGLSEDDLAVWRQVARSAKPLGPDRPRAPAAPAKPPRRAEPEGGQGSGETEPRAPLSPFRIGEASDRSAGHDLRPTLEGQIAAQPLRMDRKTFGRMKKGKLAPERKLDLHGMTLAQAHPALTRFIRAAHGDGCRLVIVVTGKGRTGADEGGPIPTPRGVLRHQVPGWLNGAALRPYVLQVTDAHQRHGGAGAYYVYLRRGPGGGAPRG